MKRALSRLHWKLRVPTGNYVVRFSRNVDIAYVRPERPVPSVLQCRCRPRRVSIMLCFVQQSPESIDDLLILETTFAPEPAALDGLLDLKQRLVQSDPLAKRRCQSWDPQSPCGKLTS